MYYDIRQIRIILIVIGLVLLVIGLAAFGVSNQAAVPAGALAPLRLAVGA